MRSLTWMLACAAVVASAPAAVMFGNYPPTNDGTNTANLSTTRFKAIGFTTGPSIWILNGIRVRLRLGNTSVIPVVQVRSGITSSSAGTLVASLTAPTFLAGTADYLFTADGTFAFAANAQYWVVVRNNNSVGGLDWMGSNPGVVPTGSGTYNQALFTTNGTTFSASAGLNTFEILGTLQGTNAVVSASVVLGDVDSPMTTPRNMAYSLAKGTTTLASGSLTATIPTSLLTMDVPASETGIATLTLDGGPFLKRVRSVVLSGGNVAIGAVNMVNGDVDQSGEVDAADIDQVIAAFGATTTGNEDVDSSGEVDAADIDIVIARFGATDDSAP